MSKVVTKSILNFKEWHKDVIVKIKTTKTPSSIDRLIPMGYFDGAAREHGSDYGASVVIKFHQGLEYHIK